MTRIIKELFKKEFVRNITILASGTIAAQAIILLSMPIITRLYGPEAYGLMGIFLSIFTFIIPVAALTYPTAIVLPKRVEEAINIIKSSLLVTFVLSLLSLIFLIFYYQELASILKVEKNSILLFTIPIVILTSGTKQVFRQWLIRNNNFKVLSRVSVYEPLFIYGGMVIVGLFYPTATVLILFTAAKTVVSATAIFIILIKKKDEVLESIRRQKNSLKETFTRYKDFPLFQAPLELINSSAHSLPILLLAIFFGPATAGFYSIGRTALSIPSRLIGDAIGDVFYPRISKAANENEDVTLLLKKSTLILFLIAIMPYGLIIVFGPQLFSVIFGEEWAVAGEYARWLSVWLLFSFANKPCIKALPVLSAQGFYLKFTIVSLLIKIVALLIGFYLFESDVIAVAFYSIASAILEIVLLFISFRISKRFKINKVKI